MPNPGCLFAILLLACMQGCTPEIQYFSYEDYQRSPCISVLIPNCISIEQRKNYDLAQIRSDGDTVEVMLSYILKDSTYVMDSTMRIGGLCGMVNCLFGEEIKDTCSIPNVWMNVMYKDRTAYYIDANSSCALMLSFDGYVDIPVRYKMIRSVQMWRKYHPPTREY